MHILILPSFYPDESNSNLGAFFKEQVKTIAEHGIRVNVIYVEQKSLRKFNFLKLIKNHFQSAVTIEEKWKEFRIIGWKIPGIIGRKIWIYQSTRLVEKYIAEEGKPYLIHVHNIFWAGVVANNVFKKFRIPFIITEHSSAFLVKNGISLREQEIALQVYSNASKIIAVSKSLRRAIEKIGPKLEIDIIPNIVDTDFFRPGKQKQDEDNIIKFLAIGNLNSNKGHNILIDAFYNVTVINQNVTLNICGDGPEKEKLRKLIQAYKLENMVKLTGHLNKSQILEKLQESNCLIVTSYFETFGVVLIEAMSSGIPYITTKCGGPEDIFEEGVGYMVEPGNAELLAETMIKFINHKNSFSGSSIRSIAIQKYGRETFYEKMMQAYSEVV